jgi:CelD/BcsL family acetyltransferase involved in cellulose biosynthesis
MNAPTAAVHETAVQETAVHEPAVHEIDPVRDARWPRFLERHKLATVFHSPEWLDALRRTYGYQAAALTTSEPGAELCNALLFCHVKSWVTGRRIVSVPFSDHCTPLVSGEGELPFLLASLTRKHEGRRGKYIEIRPLGGQPEIAHTFSPSANFCLHRLDLRPSLDELHSGFHNSCVRCKISRAQREDFLYEEGRSESHLKSFYQLAVLTRRRHHLPPQPLAWFRNLIGCLGEKVKIRLLFHSGRPAAGILTIRFKRTMTYKYGFSDSRFHKLGSMQLLLWKAIQEAKQEGLLELDLGRSEWANEGLVAFKDRWGATRSALNYFRYPPPELQTAGEGLQMRAAKWVFAVAPDSFLTTAGNLLYRHIA